MSSRPELPVGSAAVTFLRSSAIAAVILLVPPAPEPLAAEPCGSPALTLQDLNTLARDVALANRVAPHSLHLRDEELRSALVSMSDRTERGVPTDVPLGQRSPGAGRRPLRRRLVRRRLLRGGALGQRPGAACESTASFSIASLTAESSSAGNNGTRRA